MFAAFGRNTLLRGLFLGIISVFCANCEIPANDISFQNGLIREFSIGKQIQTPRITTITNVGFMGCLEECQRRLRCKSVNYKRRFLLCELNYIDGTEAGAEFTTSGSSMFLQKWNWLDGVLADACSGLSCQIKSSCVESIHGRPVCKISDCGFPPYVNGTTLQFFHEIGLFAKVSYRCDKATVLEGKGHVGCQGYGEWSPVDFYCRDLCPEGWTWFNGACYYFETTEQMTWPDAKARCERIGGFLADIISVEENEFIKGQLTDISMNFWLGGTDRYEEGVWRWSRSDPDRDSKLTNTAWGRGEPNGDVMEQCLMLIHDNLWNDAYCSTKLPFICEMMAQAL